MQRIDIFVKQGYDFNLSSGMTGDKWNMPMYNKNIKLFKGIDNKVQFSIRDHDRKPYHLGEKELVLKIINPRFKEPFVKSLTCDDKFKGLFSVSFTDKELRDFDVTTYTATVYAQKINEENPEIIEEQDLLYSGTDWTPMIYIEIADDVVNGYKPSVQLNPETFLHNFYIQKEDGQRYDYYVSSRIKADDSDYHTASVTVEDNFVGKVIMEASMEVNPENNEADWMNVKELIFVNPPKEEEKTEDSNVNDETLEVVIEGIENKDGTYLMNESGNFMWIRFKIISKASEASGSVTEILYRN